jgi:type IV secretion system protein VirD4
MGLGIPRMALEMMRSDNAGLRNKAAQFTNWNKEIQSIVSSARTQTESFDDVGIATDLEKNGIDFEDLKREPVTVYLILPPDMMERNAKWLRLLLTSAIHGVLRVRRKGEPRVLFMLDEFYALGHLEIIATVWALVRGYGIRLMPMLQDLGQLKTLYPKMWESFIGNAGVTTTFCTNDPTTAEWFSKRAGETTRDIESSSTTYSSGSSKVEGAYGPNAPGPNQITRTSGTSTVTSSAPQKTTLITAHKLNGLPPFYMMGFFNGMAHAVPIYAPPYFDIADCRRKARDNPYYLNED